MWLDSSNKADHLYWLEFPAKDAVADFFLFHDKLSMQTEFPYHEHDLYEIYFHLSGNVKFYITGEGHNLSRGDIVIVRPGEIHRPVNESGKDYEMVIILINRSFIDELQKSHPNIDVLFDRAFEDGFLYIPAERELIENIDLTLAKLEKSVDLTKSEKSAALKNVHFLELLYLINGKLGTAGNTSSVFRSNEKVGTIIKYINDNISGNLSLNVLSEMFYISKYHLSREFSKHAGCTLHQYILQRRLSIAKKMIDENKTLEGIYDKCGFDNYVTFLLAFKKRFGITPKDYLNQLSGMT